MWCIKGTVLANFGQTEKTFPGWLQLAQRLNKVLDRICPIYKTSNRLIEPHTAEHTTMDATNNYFSLLINPLNFDSEFLTLSVRKERKMDAQILLTGTSWPFRLQDDLLVVSLLKQKSTFASSSFQNVICCLSVMVN